MEKTDLNKIVAAILAAGFCAGKNEQTPDSVMRTYETFAGLLRQHEESAQAKQRRGGG
jgi:hypothetical protein